MSEVRPLFASSQPSLDPVNTRSVAVAMGLLVAAFVAVVIAASCMMLAPRKQSVVVGRIQKWTSSIVGFCYSLFVGAQAAAVIDECAPAVKAIEIPTPTPPKKKRNKRKNKTKSSSRKLSSEGVDASPSVTEQEELSVS
jgi:hypothetical protein